MDTLLQKLIDWFASASPQLWAVLIRQVYTRALVDFVWVAAFVVFNLYWRKRFFRAYDEIEAFNKTCEYEYQKMKASDLDDKAWYLTALHVSSGIIGMMLIGDILMILVNPEYQAIMLILGNLK